MSDGALEPVFTGGMALLAEARTRLADPVLIAALDGPSRAGLSVLLLDLSAALLLLRAAAEGDMDAQAACTEAERLDMPGQVAQVLTPVLRAGCVPALQVVLLQVSGLAAQVLGLLDALAHQSTVLPTGMTSAGAWTAREGASAAEPEDTHAEKPRRRPSERPRLRVVSSKDGPRGDTP